MPFIIKSKKLVWEGKGFTASNAKIYPNAQYGMDDLLKYLYWESDTPPPATFTWISDRVAEQMVRNGEARF